MIRHSNFNDFVIAYTIYNDIEYGVTVKANSFAKSLNVAYHMIVRVTGKLAKAGLIVSKRGYSNGGITKQQGFSIEDVFSLYGYEYSDSPELKERIKKTLVDLRYKPIFCDICGVGLSGVLSEKMCTECSITTQDPNTKRLAKCGHFSADRYFNCRECEPVLPDDEQEFDLI